MLPVSYYMHILFGHRLLVKRDQISSPLKKQRVNNELLPPHVLLKFVSRLRQWAQPAGDLALIVASLNFSRLKLVNVAF